MGFLCKVQAFFTNTSAFIKRFPWIGAQTSENLRKVKNCFSFSKEHIIEAKKYYMKNSFKVNEGNWNPFYDDIMVNFPKEYLPKDLFRPTLEYVLNKIEAYPNLTDKNLLSKHFIGIKQPETPVKNIQGTYFHNDKRISKKQALELCRKYDRLVIKPSIGSGIGERIVLFSVEGDLTDYKGMALCELFESYEKDFLVQEVIEQHKLLRLMNPSSLNVLRIVTDLREKEPVILSASVRMGRQGDIVSGGLYCGIKPNGQLNDFGYDDMFEKVTETDEGIAFNAVKLSFFRKVKDAVNKLHPQMPYFKMISWDLAVDKDEEVILINYSIIGQEVKEYQIANRPLYSA
ncbi:sugar-transfer associated ATP-grasp domain-containing protein [Leptobacterium sp. I13]|uniref:sugar-transfer associated ATP-grasp domain-containing protein n=1 Tax=Leptobacterium meishanense TaxID=3128904 RepID=UPI0030ED2D32